MNRIRYMFLILLLGTVLLTGAFPYASHSFIPPVSAVDSVTDSAEEDNSLVNPSIESAFEPYYMDVLKAWEEEGARAAEKSVVIPASSIAGQSEGASVTIGSYAGKEDVLIWENNRTEWIEYVIDVPAEGMYEMALTYHSFNNEDAVYQSYRPTTMAVSVDGEYMFNEARAIEFTRWFRDEQPFKTDANGNHIRPKPIELEQWITQPFQDAEGTSSLPLKWKLTEGKHKLRFQSFAPIVMGQIELTPPSNTRSYEDIKASMPENASEANEVIVIEAENMLAKNDVAIQAMADQDPLMTPDAENKSIYNGVGGTRWQNGGGAITWTFTVPESGRYRLGMRAFQGYQSSKQVFRKVMIDGKVPFEELLAYPISYSTGWQGLVLSSNTGEPYEFYLEKGDHTLTLAATYAPYHAVLNEQEQVLASLRALSENINTITGGVEDTARTWRIKENFPELITETEGIAKSVERMVAMLLEVNGEVDANSQSLSTAVKDLEDILRYPNDIPYKLEDLSLISSRIASITTSLTTAPLALDKLYIAPAGTDFPRMEANWGEKTLRNVTSFFHSFSSDNRLSASEEEVLNIWVNYGRDYVNLIQEMADQYFTPETGIQVQVDLLPDENLLVMANAAGKSPDIALGMTEGRPIELAIRGAVEKLSDYPGFDELFAAYSPGSTLPYYFDNGYYALPETQRFQVLYYRKDILQQLGLDVPDTWEDVIRMLPTLQQNGYNFHIPYNDYMTFLYQYGAEFYSETGMKTALDSPEAFSGFKLMTDLFNVYGIERQVPSFYQHFRDGDMPIGIADFNFYLQMRVAAPELDGWWGMAPLPGIYGDSGEVERWTGGNQTAASIFSNSNLKEEAWKFLQWWLSSETQQRFGNDLEGFYGVAFRWNTANLDAFTGLPWNEEELAVMLEQWRWYKDMANLPGSYLIPREVMNAWNRTVLSGQNYRDALEEGTLSIDREIWRKAREFGFIDSQGSVVDTYDPPQVTEPWKGVDKYVNP
ncbi:extracellular solute-binding protein [Neobacillus mesonae]|nr:extracellular solute-binding protein [Neobacillus mesonae]